MEAFGVVLRVFKPLLLNYGSHAHKNMQKARSININATDLRSQEFDQSQAM